MIFSGEIIQPIQTKDDNVTTVLVLICKDGDEYLNKSFTAKTISKGSVTSDIIKAVTDGEEITIGDITDDLTTTALARGKVLFGRSSSYLQQIARQSEAQMYVEDGAVNIVSAKDYSGAEAVQLDPTSGLIGTPEQTDDGIKFQCLINPRIKLNSKVYIHSNLVIPQQVETGKTSYKKVSSTGVYKVFKIATSGDTRGDEWYMDCEATTMTDVKPSGLTGDQTSLWR